jgi:hypothetical protein
MTKTALESVLRGNASTLMLYGFVRGAMWATANGVPITKIIDAYLNLFDPDKDAESARKEYYRTDEKFREAEKGK